MKRTRSSALLALSSLAAARNAAAVDATQATAAVASDTTIGVAYDAPSPCPDASAFLDRVRARTAHVDLVPDAEVARFAVIVSSSDTDSSARIRFSGADGQLTTRTVNGRTCDEVVSAAALITALAIEATRSGAPTEAPDPATPPPNPPVRDIAVSPPSESQSHWLRGWGLGAMGGLESWMPGGGYLAGVFGEIAAGAPLDLVRLALRGTMGSTSVDARSATFTRLTARLSVCPVSLRMAEPLSLVPCAGLEMGRLAGQGEASADLATPRSAAIFWSSAGAELLARWQLGSMVMLEAGGELEFPLVRHTFVFQGPARLVYDVPTVGVGAHAALVMRFH